MMGILGGYMTRLLLARLLVILFGLAALAILLDLLANADEIIDLDGSVSASLMRYAVLRLPDVLSRSIPVAVLLATLMALSALVRYSELTAMYNAGMSQFRLLFAFLPAAVVVGAGQFLIEDQWLPTAARQLRAWGAGDYGNFTSTDRREMAWFRQDGNFVRIQPSAAFDGGPSEVTIFRRDPEGQLLERIAADSADYANGAWILKGVTRTNVRAAEVGRLTSLVWPGAIDRSVLPSLAVHPRELSWRDLSRLAESSGFGNRPAYLYEAYLHKKIAGPVATVLMVLLAVALVQWMRPRRQSGLILAAGIGVGFLYWILDKFVLTIGEAGLLPSALAAWTPAVVLAAASCWVILAHET